jgi:hypothetical protein
MCRSQSVNNCGLKLCAVSGIASKIETLMDEREC